MFFIYFQTKVSIKEGLTCNCGFPFGGTRFTANPKDTPSHMYRSTLTSIIIIL